MGKNSSLNERKLKSAHISRVMLAAPKSGSGKTLITCALLETIKTGGLAPRSFKCGPDYIDPMFHKKVLGIDNKNLDAYFAGAEGVKRILGESGEGYAVLEGVMGLYDGLNVATLEGSSYEIASLTKTPIILIVDASSVGKTVISSIKGILLDDKEGLIKGIILNKISENFYKSLAPILKSELKDSGFGAKVLGFMPKVKEINLESRHLGLIMPEELDNIQDMIKKASDVLCEKVDMDALLELMKEAEPLTYEEAEVKGSDANSEGLTLAVAYDEAFCFYYKENLEMFERRGVKIKYFSPIHDKELPSDADGILLGGGYPELHLEELSGNETMRSSMRTAIESGLPSLAECGGFIYLHRACDSRAGDGCDKWGLSPTVTFPMAGVVDGVCKDAGKLVRFGYMELESCRENTGFYNAAAGLRGHEFHYFDSTDNGSAFVAKKPNKDVKWDCMIARNNGFWGFPHFYYGSKPEFVDAFIDKMREVKNGKLK
jgi:cobyrinic acid a,c-diamide synthase